MDAGVKRRIDMSRGGRAWRGYFSVGDELTSGLPDIKEGIYFGRELSSEHHLVRANTPMHGPNLWPITGENNTTTPDDDRYRDLVLTYKSHMTRIGRALMQAMALALELPRDFFDREMLAEPLCLFRIFNYPSPAEWSSRLGGGPLWSVGEHTDYGFITVLHQDQSGGLQVRARKDGSWQPVPPVRGTLVVNLGDMLEKVTGGVFVSTPHRVLNPRDRDRLSFPFFFDPDFNAELRSLVPLAPRLQHLSLAPGRTYARWDGQRRGLADVTGTYGEYIMGKVSKVFPQLAQSHIEAAAPQ
jgi:isopenicillin N synthase-like dioxygenase